jgi:hypothetical protein
MLLFLNSYSDPHSTNNPDRNGIKWTRELNGIPVQDAGQTMPFTLAPGESKTLFNTTRTLLQDTSTQYSISLGVAMPNTYTLTAVGGTLPNFRTPRTTGEDATTQVTVTLNGPVATFSTPTPGTFASFMGYIPGMFSSVTLTANTSGSAGNSISLLGNGISSVNSLITAWNTANPGNQVTLTAGSGLQIPNAGMFASFTGIPTGTATSVTITANVIGAGGNSVLLIGDGTSSISTLITNWNTANPSNQVTLTSGDGTQVPSGGTNATFTGTPPGLSTSITLEALNVGSLGNFAFLIGDGLSDINTLIANWNINMPSNRMELASGDGTQVPTSLTSINLSGGINPAMIVLSSGVTSALTLSGGSTTTQFNLISGGVVVGDKVRIGNLFNVSNQGEWKIIALTATSFSIANPSAVAEGPIALGSGFASQVQIYSAAGVQINDTLVISSGFSQVSWASYLVTSVSANSLQFYTTAILPQEGPITTEIAIYESAKNLVYLETDQTCELTINGVDAGDVEPWVSPNCIAPGMYLRKATIYSMSVLNTSTNAANLLFASVE